MQMNTNTPSGPSANSRSATDGPAQPAAPATPTRPRMVFRRTIVPSPSGAGRSSSVRSLGAGLGRLSTSGQRPARSTGATVATTTHAVQPGQTWASVVARNRPSPVVTIPARSPEEPAPEEAPAEAPVFTPVRPRRRAISQAPASQTATTTFASPLEEGARTLTHFHPMDAVYEGAEANMPAWDRDLQGFSPNYRGNMNNPRNRANVGKEDENCGLFIMNLPPDGKVGDLLDGLVAIGPFGKVYQTHVMPPYGLYSKSSARLMMWDRWSARRVLEAIQVGRLVISDQIARAIWDKNPRVPDVRPGDYLSRTLIISGPIHIVDPEYLYDYLSERIFFQTQRVSVLSEDDEERTIRWIFGSFYAQAQPAHMALRRRWPPSTGVTIMFGIDPMDVGEGRMEPSLRDVYAGPDSQRTAKEEDDEDNLIL